MLKYNFNELAALARVHIADSGITDKLERV